MEVRKVGVLIGLENRDGVDSPVGVRSPRLPPERNDSVSIFFQKKVVVFLKMSDTMGVG